MRSSYTRVLFGGLLLLAACMFGTSFVTGSKASGTTPFTPYDDSFTIHGGTVVSFVANDDFAGYTPYAVIVDAPSHGTISGGSLYVPDIGYTGSDRGVCEKISNPSDRRACYAHAMERYSSCLAGRPIPHNPWPAYPWK